jgi:plastocyanin
MLAASAATGALLVPGLALAADQVTTDAPAQNTPPATQPMLTPDNVRPVAKLTATQKDGTVSWDATASKDLDGHIVAYEWDLDGDGLYELSGADPRATSKYPPGSTVIAGLRVIDDSGASDDDTLAVTIDQAAPTGTGTATPAPAVPIAPAQGADPQPLVPTSHLDASDAGTAPAAPASGRAAATPVRAAASGSVTIKDFQFGPTKVTINAGDSVTWQNQGPTGHTATAKSGEFDSGLLAKGSSFSHKFTKPGTYSYFCKPHPFMTATIVVTGASSGGGGSSGSGSGSSGSGSSGDTGSGGTGSTAGSGSGAGTASGDSSGSLARTGRDLLPWALFGASLFAFGYALRWRLVTE